MLTTVQDFGRPNFREYGVPVGGVLDRSSAKLANGLVGNDFKNPVLEITMMGPEIYFDYSCHIAITGADISPKINGEEAAMNAPLFLEKNSILNFGRLKYGCRAYMAVAGKWKLDTWLGSVSALPFSGLNILEKNKIEKGSEIVIEKNDHFVPLMFPENKNYHFPNSINIRTMPGPEFEKLPRIYIAHFFSQTFRISPDSNRMGCRLDGALPKYKPEKEMISSGVVPGTIQVANNGQPIVLLADAQTVGGYPRLANVFNKDMDKLAQLKPGDELRFVM